MVRPANSYDLELQSGLMAAVVHPNVLVRISLFLIFCKLDDRHAFTRMDVSRSLTFVLRVGASYDVVYPRRPLAGWRHGDAGGL